MNSAPLICWDQKQWYAVYTVVRHEKIVNATLNRKQIETFLPLRDVTSQWKDRRKVVRLPLFPGYLFVNTSDQERSTVLTTSGVLRILGANNKPIAIPGEQIETIKTLLESKLKFDPYPYLQHGRDVVIMKGALRGIKGRMLERRGAYRLILSIDMIQRSLSVEVDSRDVELF